MCGEGFPDQSTASRVKPGDSGQVIAGLLCSLLGIWHKTPRGYPFLDVLDAEAFDVRPDSRR